MGHPHIAAVGLQETHDHVQRNGLAHTAAAEDANRFSRHDVETQVADDDLAAEGFVYVFELDVRLAFVH